MGRELKRIGAPFRQPEWSALPLIEAPETVATVHQNFINAGAQVITTNAYALVPFHIGQDRFQKDAYPLAERAATIARKVAGDAIKVAGCIPPAFGSYKPELFLPDLLDPILTPLIVAQEDHIDFWLVETQSSVIEAESTLRLLRSKSDKPVWLSFTLNNREGTAESSALRSMEPTSAIKGILPDLDAVLFNCSRPEEILNAIQITRSVSPDIPIGAYANNFAETKRTQAANEGVTPTREDITPEAYLEFAKQWAEAGATIIGGCCGIGPEHIRALSNYFK